MAVFVVGLVLLLAIAEHSDAAYCVCNSGGDGAFQKNIDYACGAGADCSPILQNGPCYNPNTLKDHCNYAVNSYYQRKGQIPGSCDFAGTAIVSPTSPSAASGCVYQASPSNPGTTTPSTTPNTTTGGTPTTGGTTTPVGGTTTPVGGTMPGGGGTTFTPGGGIGLAPSGAGFSNPDGSDSVTLLSTSKSATFMLLFFSLIFVISSLVCPNI